VWISEETKFDTFELDELHSFINRAKPLDLRENTYLMTMISRTPRQIAAFDVDKSVSSARLQSMVDSVPPANRYCTDGLKIYLDVDFLGGHVYNVDDKSDTRNVESVNADLRHYIPALRRRSRCFFRTLETFYAVLSVFADAYNKFGEAKLKRQIPVQHRSACPDKRLHKFRQVPFSILDFL
jgi:IS1 family transposase